MELALPRGKAAESIVRSTRRLNIWEGSVSSGKTVSSILAWLNFIAQGPPGELLMSGKTERTLKRNVIDPIREMVGPDAIKGTGAGGEVQIFGRTVYIAGANDERAEGKIRGLSLVGAYGDEFTLWPESYFAMLLSRLRRPGARLFGTTNPDGPAHWLKKNYLDRGDELDLARFHFTLDDNPNLDPAYVTAIKTEYVGLWYKRFVLGLWVLAEGAIYEGWDPERHVVSSIPPITRWWVGADYGTVNPFVALLLGLGVDGRVYAVSEYRWDSHRARRQKTDSEYSADVRAWLAQPRQMGDYAPTVPDPSFIIVDPSAASFIRQLFSDHVHGVRPADNEVVDGIRLTASTLALDRLRIHESCAGLIEEFPGYVWDPDKQEKGLDEPVKLNDHSLDALRYGLKTARTLWYGVPLRTAA